MAVTRSRSAFAMTALTIALFCAPAAGQELAPHAYWPTPKGLNVFTVGYVYTNGDVLVDPSVPVDGVSARTNSVTLGYHRTLGLGGRLATVTAVLPLSTADFDLLGESGRTLSTSGFADLQVRVGLNVLGARAMTPQEYQAYRQDPPRNLLGVSLKVQVPTGDFNPDRVANVGTSRWSIKPEIGYIRVIGKKHRWAVEAALGIWFYGRNENFLVGQLRQKPIFGPEFHAVRKMSRGMWISFDWNYYEGGQTTVDGQDKDNKQRNSRFGLTLNYPVKQHAFRVSLSDSLRVETGGDYWSGLVTWSYAWR